MTPKEIIKLSSTDALALHARGVGGDDSALADYIKWSTWRFINKKDEFNDVQKLKAFLSFVSNFELVVDRG